VNIFTRQGGRVWGGETADADDRADLDWENPSLVLLDEPSEDCHRRSWSRWSTRILTMKKEGVSIVVSEQNLHFARLISDRAYIIERAASASAVP